MIIEWSFIYFTFIISIIQLTFIIAMRNNIMFNPFEIYLNDYNKKIIGLIYSLLFYLLVIMNTLYQFYFNIINKISIHISIIYYIHEIIFIAGNYGYGMFIQYIIVLISTIYFLNIQPLYNLSPFIHLIYITNLLSNFGYILSINIKKKSYLYIINMILLWISLLLFRIINIPYIIYKLFKNEKVEKYMIVFIVLFIGIWFLSIFWIIFLTKKIWNHYNINKTK